MSSIGDQPLFISDKRTLSISAGCFPSVEENSIYFVQDVKLIGCIYRMGCVYNLTRKGALNLHLFCVLHELNHMWKARDLVQRKERRILIRPYSLRDHILCYCYQQAWCKGLMFLELDKKNFI